MEGATMGQEGETRVTLLVRAPDQQIDDHTIECELDWNVARLKDHLALVYPSKPVSFYASFLIVFDRKFRSFCGWKLN